VQRLHPNRTRNRPVSRPPPMPPRAICRQVTVCRRECRSGRLGAASATSGPAAVRTPTAQTPAGARIATRWPARRGGRPTITGMPAGRAEPEHSELRTAMMLSELVRRMGREPGWARGEARWLTAARSSGRRFSALSRARASPSANFLRLLSVTVGGCEEVPGSPPFRVEVSAGFGVSRTLRRSRRDRLGRRG
jgi:hypothetical protein